MRDYIKIKALLISVSFLVCSCSFNMGVRINKQDEPSISIIPTKCNVFVLPELETTPTSPISEIMRINSKNKDAQIAVLVNHIKELKEHSTKQKATIINQYRNYLQSCK